MVLNSCSKINLTLSINDKLIGVFSLTYCVNNLHQEVNNLRDFKVSKDRVSKKARLCNICLSLLEENCSKIELIVE